MQKILIVDDEPAYVRLLSDRLAGDYRVLTAANGKLGLRLARQHRPDVILLDSVMPEMDGLSMLAELRKDAYGQVAKVIILTNLEASAAVIAQLAKVHPAHYFVKSDISFDELITKIRELLKQGRAGDAEPGMQS